MTSKLSLLIISVIFSFLIHPSVNAQQNTKCIALITGISGDVFLKKANDIEFVRTSWGTQLFNGDQIKTTANSGTTLAFSNNNIIKVAQNSEITISGDWSKTENSEEIVKNVSAGMMIDLSEIISKKTSTKEEGAMAGLRSLKTENFIYLISPANTNIKTLRPSFLWSSKGSFSNFVVTLYNSQGLEWTIETKENWLNYPENEKELENGVWYSWNVEGKTLNDSEKTDNIKFSILTIEKSNEIKAQEILIREAFKSEKENSSLHSLLGAYYINQGLFHDALNEFQKVCEINAESPGPHQILGSLYSRMGIKDKATEEWKKAIELSEEE